MQTAIHWQSTIATGDHHACIGASADGHTSCGAAADHASAVDQCAASFACCHGDAAASVELGSCTGAREALYISRITSYSGEPLGARYALPPAAQAGLGLPRTQPPPT